jgi:hypothetical protein
MTVQRADLFKVCQKMNWKGDVRALWKVLDHDGSQVTTLEELDAHCAQLLANFKRWAENNFGSKPSSHMFRAFDRVGARKLRYAQFVQECQARGFHYKVKTLALWLDWQDKKYLIEEDFEFLDTWKPPAWLIAQPNPRAASDFKKTLLNKYGHYLKAWRCCLDKDNSNACNWHEFQEASRHLKFSGDIAGAWLDFDQDLSGYITLKEIDASAHDALVAFKMWADDEFGGVRSAFKVLDSDGSNELSFREFRGACRNFGFQGEIRALFDALDQAPRGDDRESEQMLQYKEVVFLDDWETHLPVSAEGVESQQELQKQPEEVNANMLLDYTTFSPGPGAYDVYPGFATMRHATARHSGAFTFTKRRPLPALPKSVGPARYDPSLKYVAGSKPAWSFSCAARGEQRTPRLKPHGTSSRSVSLQGTPREMPSPGPGSYDLKSSYSGPRYSMRPRRVLSVHPTERPPSDGCRAFSR